MHDKRIADEMYSFPYECILQQDTGYQGYSPDNVTVIHSADMKDGEAEIGYWIGKPYWGQCLIPEAVKAWKFL